MFEGGTLRPKEREFIRDVLLTTAVKGCLKSRLLSPASKDRSRTSRLSHSRRPEIRLLDNLSRVRAVMLDVVQGCRGTGHLLSVCFSYLVSQAIFHVT